MEERDGEGKPALETHSLVKRFGSGAAEVTAVGNVSLRIATGEFTAVMGPSGSGKTTLMHLMAGLATPTEGRILLGGADITDMDEQRLTDLRRDRIGFVFQSFNLLPTHTAEQNILLPLKLAGKQPDRQYLAWLVHELGLQDRTGHKPSQLSGGQQQRVAIARALMSRPAVVFADEPTGALDISSGRSLLTHLRTACDDLGQTIVMVTHDPHAASYADRVVLLADGAVREQVDSPSADAVLTALSKLEP